MTATRRMRHALADVLRPLMLRIRAGPLRGLRWSIVSGSRFIKGTYEPAVAAALAELIEAGDTVFDIGAHVGYFTAVAALRAGPDGHVYAFEPRPRNFELLTRHVRVNRLSNVTPLPSAVGAQPGAARFETRTGSGRGHLDEGGDIRVRVMSLDAAVAAGELELPDVIKIDVEGGELDVLAGARSVLEEARPRIILATHGEELHHRCVGELHALGYSTDALAGMEAELVARPS